MKTERIFSVASLVIAVAALGHSFWVQSRTETLAREAIQRREAELVRAATPKVIEVVESMVTEPFNSAAFKPVTFEELAAPLVRLMTAMPAAAEIGEPPADDGVLLK